MITINELIFEKALNTIETSILAKRLSIVCNVGEQQLINILNGVIYSAEVVDEEALISYIIGKIKCDNVIITNVKPTEGNQVKVEYTRFKTRYAKDANETYWYNCKDVQTDEYCNKVIVNSNDSIIIEPSLCDIVGINVSII